LITDRASPGLPCGPAVRDSGLPPSLYETGGSRSRPWPFSLAPQPQALDQGSVAFDVLSAEVLEQPPAPPDHLEEPSSLVVILLMGLEVLGELIDAPGQDGDLDLGRTGIGLGPPEVADQRGFLVFQERHGIPERLTQTP